MSGWDVLYGEMNAALHLALDEQLLARAKEGKHTLLFPEYTTPSLVLSNDQHVLDYLGNGELEYTRRITPGGAMLCSRNVLPFSIAVPRTLNNQLYLTDPVHAHEVLGGAIMHVLQSFGVTDMVLGTQHAIKIKRAPKDLPLMGTSQRREGNAYLYHGVITLDPWDADYLNRIIRLRTKGAQREYDKIKDLPYVRAYCDKGLDELKTELRAALAEQFAGTRELRPIPQDMLADAETIVEHVYRNDRWRRQARHPTRKNLSRDSLRTDLGFCLLGDDPF